MIGEWIGGARPVHCRCECRIKPTTQSLFAAAGAKAGAAAAMILTPHVFATDLAGMLDFYR